MPKLIFYTQGEESFTSLGKKHYRDHFSKEFAQKQLFGFDRFQIQKFLA